MARPSKRLFVAPFVSRLSAVAVVLLVGCSADSGPRTAPPAQPEKSPTAAVHALRGSQVYDVAQREWISAELHIDVGFDLYQDARKVGRASGTMNLTMNIQDAKPTEQD